jgi:hypothetical protein
MKFYRLASLILLIPLWVACVDPYVPKVSSENPNYLVIDGYLNTATGYGVYKLTHTIGLTEDGTPSAELSANVFIESDQNENFPALAGENGIYEFKGLTLSSDKRYRLHIITSGKKEYISEYAQIHNTPPIDSVTWRVEEDALTINVNTHDPSGKSRFYRWLYDETWEYTTTHTSLIKLVNEEVLDRAPNEYINRCWRSDNLKTILIATTKQLDQDLVSDFNLLKIAEGSIKTSIKYSILVRQQTLSESSYNYWNNLKKTTESLGGLFDPLPGQITGNFQCITDPSEPVIGYFEIGSISEQRIYIEPIQFPKGFRRYSYPACEMDTVLVEQVDGVSNPNSLIAEVWTREPPSILIGYSTAAPYCIDCRVLDKGKTVPPDFWE